MPWSINDVRWARHVTSPAIDDVTSDVTSPRNERFTGCSRGVMLDLCCVMSPLPSGTAAQMTIRWWWTNKPIYRIQTVTLNTADGRSKAFIYSYSNIRLNKSRHAVRLMYVIELYISFFWCWFLLYFLFSSFYHIMMNKDVYICKLSPATLAF